MRGLKSLTKHEVEVLDGSHSLRNAWIEIFCGGQPGFYWGVAFPAECVD